jgi:hypothetical protein
MALMKMITLYWSDDNDVQRSKQIGFETVEKLVAFLIDKRHEHCRLHTFDDEHFFFCFHEDLERIFRRYTTFYLVRKNVVRCQGKTTFGCNLVCYTEEQLRNMDIPGTVLELPNQREMFISRLNKLPAVPTLPQGVIPALDVHIKFYMNDDYLNDDGVEEMVHIYLYYDRNEYRSIIAFAGLFSVIEDYCEHHTLYNILENILYLHGVYLETITPQTDASLRVEAIPIGEIDTCIRVDVAAKLYY